MTATPVLNRTFGQLLREARTGAGLTQAEVALRFGITKASVTQWENDLILPRAERFPVLEDAYGLDPGTAGAWVRHSPLYLATLRAVSGDGDTPG